MAVGIAFIIAALPWPDSATSEPDILWDPWSLLLLGWAALVLGGLLTWL